MQTNGISIELPTDFGMILNSQEWNAKSYSTQSGNLGLVLTLYKDSMITKICSLKLNKLCEI